MFSSVSPYGVFSSYRHSVAFSGRSDSQSPEPTEKDRNYQSHRGYPSSYGRKEYGTKEAEMAKECDSDTASLAEKRRQVRLAASAFKSWEKQPTHPGYGEVENKLVSAVRTLKQRLGKK